MRRISLHGTTDHGEIAPGCGQRIVGRTRAVGHLAQGHHAVVNALAHGRHHGLHGLEACEVAKHFVGLGKRVAQTLRAQRLFFVRKGAVDRNFHQGASA